MLVKSRLKILQARRYIPVNKNILLKISNIVSRIIVHVLFLFFISVFSNSTLFRDSSASCKNRSISSSGIIGSDGAIAVVVDKIAGKQKTGTSQP